MRARCTRWPKKSTSRTARLPAHAPTAPETAPIQYACDGRPAVGSGRDSKPRDLEFQNGCGGSEISDPPRDRFPTLRENIGRLPAPREPPPEDRDQYDDHDDHDRLAVRPFRTRLRRLTIQRSCRSFDRSFRCPPTRLVRHDGRRGGELVVDEPESDGVYARADGPPPTSTSASRLEGRASGLNFPCTCPSAGTPRSSRRASAGGRSPRACCRPGMPLRTGRAWARTSSQSKHT